MRVTPQPDYLSDDCKQQSEQERDSKLEQDFSALAQAVAKEDFDTEAANYHATTFRFAQMVSPGWVTINDLTVDFFPGGEIEVRMDPYISRPQHIEFKFTLLDQWNQNLVTEIIAPVFSYPNVHDQYLPGQLHGFIDYRCPPALQYARQLQVAGRIWG